MQRELCRLLVFAGISTLATPGFASREGVTEQGQPYITGGAGVESRDRLGEQAREYSVRISTAAKSGHYVADARVKIIDHAGKTALDTTMDGPWLFVQLRPGTYKIEASYGGQIQQRQLNVRRSEHRELILYFNDKAGAAPARAG